MKPLLQIKRLLRNQEGATAIEYGLICALIVIACVAAMTAVGGSSNGMWGRVEQNVAAHL